MMGVTYPGELLQNSTSDRDLHQVPALTNAKAGFTFPAHPGELLQKPQPLTDRDPHHTTAIKTGSTCPANPGEQPQKSSPSTLNRDLLVPTLTTTSTSTPSHPILYLPPLLSSLPSSVPPLPLSSDSQPPHTNTRLPDIDSASFSLHKALHRFRPLTIEYATSPYEEAFNWAELKLPEEEEREWYCVVFRSKRKDGSDGGCLYEVDRLAHEEAVGNGGLILYWYGIPNLNTGMNLATCIWQSRKHAIAAMSQPCHIQAMRLAASSFETYTLERYVLRKMKGENGITVEKYAGGSVGC